MSPSVTPPEATLGKFFFPNHHFFQGEYRTVRYGHSSRHKNSQNIPVVHSQVDDHLSIDCE